ncbi:MAG: transglycosylase family protein [Pseudonocardia sp.]
MLLGAAAAAAVLAVGLARDAVAGGADGAVRDGARITAVAAERAAGSDGAGQGGAGQGGGEAEPGIDGPPAGGRTGAGGHDLDAVPDATVLPWFGPLSRTTAPPPEQPAAPDPDTRAPRAPAAPVEAVWDRLAACESSGDWAIATGNGYFGGLQFDVPTWREFGGTEFAPRADEATREQQVLVATRVRDARGGYGSWPACARKLDLPR